MPNVAGGAIIEVARLGRLPAARLAQPGRPRTPALANLPGLFAVQREHPAAEPATADRHRPGRVGDPSRLFEWSEWTSQAGNPVAYAPHLRAEPLAGVPAKSIILQFARGDQTVPNPTTSAIIRAGGLQDRTTLFRNDLAFAADPTFPTNPHTFLTRIPGATTSVGAGNAALAAQEQIALFFASGGATVIDPDGARRALRNADGRRTAGGPGLHPVTDVGAK